jgi:hypothetical protein
MKKSKLFLLGTLIIGMAFSLVLAGCSTTGNNGPTVEELAEQLAADINDIEAGKAVMGGDTVTLTGGVRLENAALTVPSGVTLDLTKETLQLANNAIFTVNGTVNAKAEGINIDSAATTPATINGKGTISLKSKGRMLGIYEGKKLTLDGVTLVGLSDNDDSLVGIGNGGELVMNSGAITGNTHASDEWAGGGGVEVWQGKFTMEGGTISGNSADGGGGGVHINENSTFTMKDGTISGNTARSTGGGVRAERNSTFTMEGGTISANTTADTDGGGVHINENSIFTIKDGTISGNTAGRHGGGVWVAASSTFIMKGGSISGNATRGTGSGGGVFIHISSFTMEGGTISGNTGNSGGGVYFNSGSFTMEGGRIQGTTDSDGFTKNTSRNNFGSLGVSSNITARWGMGGTYTKGGEPQIDGSEIVDGSGNRGTNDTLIAIPAP